MQLLSEADRPTDLKIKNEADLYNKANNIRKSKETQKLAEEYAEQQEKIWEAQGMLKSKESLFSTPEERLQRIKGEILSAINRAINHKEKSAIRDVKVYLKKLEQELFER